jgi:phosphoglycerate kinase
VAPAAKEKNDIEFSKKLSENIDIFVLDAFDTTHRAHASTAGIADYVSSRLAGLLLEKELEYLAGVVKNPMKPFVAIVAIVGGSKISSKITVIKVGAALVHLSVLVPGIKAGRASTQGGGVASAGDVAEERGESGEAAGSPRPSSRASSGRTTRASW